MLVKSMEKRVLFFIVTALLSMGVLFMTGCGEQTNPDTTREETEEKAAPQKPDVESLAFQKTGTNGTDTEMEEDSRKLVTVIMKPMEADAGSLKWSSSDETIVVLEDVGQKSSTIFAKAAGEADVICEAPNGVKAVLHVKVKAAPSSDDTAANTYGGNNADDGVGDTSIYDPIESFGVETPDINPVTPNMP